MRLIYEAPANIWWRQLWPPSRHLAVLDKIVDTWKKRTEKKRKKREKKKKEKKRKEKKRKEKGGVKEELEKKRIANEENIGTFGLETNDGGVDG